jgi:hypothetical protein
MSSIVFDDRVVLIIWYGVACVTSLVGIFSTSMCKESTSSSTSATSQTALNISVMLEWFASGTVAWIYMIFLICLVQLKKQHFIGLEKIQCALGSITIYGATITACVIINSVEHIPPWIVSTEMIYGTCVVNIPLCYVLLWLGKKYPVPPILDSINHVI